MTDLTIHVRLETDEAGAIYEATVDPLLKISLRCVAHPQPSAENGASA